MIKNNLIQILILFLVLTGCSSYNYQKENLDVENKAAYTIHFKMNKEGKFSAETKIDVTNLSEDEWDEILFYFIPNAFTSENKPSGLESSNTVNINYIKLNNKISDYQLNNDLLAIPIPENHKEKKQFTVTVSYEFTLPENGWRLSRVRDSYYLAQWYPMLVTYKDQNWNYVAYEDVIGETYFTDFADFEVSYEIPVGYTLTSSADKEEYLNKTKGKLKIENEKEVFVGVLKDMKMKSIEVNGTEIRVFYRGSNNELIDSTLNIAKQAFAYFEKNIGDYEDQQLDIILDAGFDMEYPGIVTVNPNTKKSWFENTIVHEIAHQWFYRKVSNNTYNENWIDEGITELTTTLFLYDELERGRALSFYYVYNRKLATLGVEKPSNLPITEYEHSYYLYSQPTLKMWELFEENGGVENGKDFLKEYFNTFKNNHVSTDEFVNFAMDYFSIDRIFFESWLQLEGGS